MDTLLKALQADGIPYPSQNVDSGRYTRWGRSKEYYAIRLSDGSGYYYGNFKNGDNGKVVFENNRCADQKLIDEAKQKLFQEQNKTHEKISKSCEYFWENMPSLETHQYLIKKKVCSYGLKSYLDKIVIPLKDTDGRIWSFQFTDRR